MAVAPDTNDMVTFLTVTAKGQVKLPEDVLRHQGVRPGDKLSVELLNDQCIELRPKPGEPVSKLFGMLKQPNRERLTIEEISDSAAAGWAGEERVPYSTYSKPLLIRP